MNHFPLQFLPFFIFLPDVVVAVRIEEEPRHVLFRIFALEGGGEVRNETRLNISSKEHTHGKDLNRSHFGYCSM